jgi:hypothetical protein
MVQATVRSACGQSRAQTAEQERLVHTTWRFAEVVVGFQAIDSRVGTQG